LITDLIVVISIYFLYFLCANLSVSVLYVGIYHILLPHGYIETMAKLSSQNIVYIVYSNIWFGL